METETGLPLAEMNFLASDWLIYARDLEISASYATVMSRVLAVFFNE